MGSKEKQIEEKKKKASEGASTFNGAGKGIVPRLLAVVLFVAVAAVVISVINDLNVGRTPEIFGYSLDFLA